MENSDSSWVELASVSEPEIIPTPTIMSYTESLLDLTVSSEYKHFKQGVLGKRLTNSNYMSILHSSMHEYYRIIKTLQKLKRPIRDQGIVEIRCSVFTLPPIVLNAMTHFISSAGCCVPFQARLDPYSEFFSDLFKTSSLTVTLGNHAGDSLVYPKQWTDPSLIATCDHTKDPYAVFYEGSESLTLDFSNPVSILKRQEELLKKTKPTSMSYNPFEQITKLNKWAILLCHGGSFSLGVFERDTLKLHKSDKKYISRKKAGRRQFNKDRKKGYISSGGSNIRREMEKTHQENIAAIMEECKKELQEADVVFLHAPGINRTFFLSEGKPLRGIMHKIRPVIVPTRRANFTNIMEVFEKLTNVVLRLDSLSS